MRGMLEGADLAGYVGQFVWLELNFDNAKNRAFLNRFGANATPTFFIIHPRNDRVTATQTGAMSLVEFKRFLDRGASVVFAKKQTPADEALTRGDTLLSQKPREAAEAYREALRVAPADWPNRELAEASLVGALQADEQWQRCAEAAAQAAPQMKRDVMFGRTVVAGMWCAVYGHPAPWSKLAGDQLEPLAEQALSLPTTVRDHRDELYRTLMYLALARHDETMAAQWGDQWLKELDSRKPANDEERSAVDIARVENIQTFGDPHRILPALVASERAMPGNWNASLRVAQMEIAAKNYEQAIAACDRGLTRHPGPAGRSWILQTKAEALTQRGEKGKANAVLAKALAAAEEIPNDHSRNNNVKKIKGALTALAAPQK